MNMLTLTVWFFFCITSKRVDTSQVSRGVHSRAELSESPVQHTHGASKQKCVEAEVSENKKMHQNTPS